MYRCFFLNKFQINIIDFKINSSITIYIYSLTKEALPIYSCKTHNFIKQNYKVSKI